MTDLLVPLDVSGNPSTRTFNPDAFFAASGAASSTSANQSLIGSGPWLVEEQEIDITYVRVPQAAQWGNSHQLSLDAFTVSAPIVKTHLEAIVNATFTSRKIYGIYNTSSFTQPQTFEIVAASADHRGNTYGGSVNAGSGLGCHGTINTKQPFHNRRAWNDSTDTEFTKSIVGATVAFNTSGSNWVE